MRKLKLLVRTAVGTLPLVVGAEVTGCSDSHGRDGASDGVAGTAGARDAEGNAGSAVGGAGSGTGGVPTAMAGVPSGGSPGSGGSDFGNPTSGGVGGFAGSFGGVGGTAGSVGGVGGSGGAMGIFPDPPTFALGSCQLYVELPEPGTPAEPGQICAATMMPVDSNRASRVTLRPDSSGDASVSRGFIDIDPALEPLLVGTPVIELLEVTHTSLEGALIEPLDPATEADGAAFTVRWPLPLFDLEADGLIRVTFRASLELSCEDTTQIVHSATDVHLCSGFAEFTWVSSGDVCSVCRIIAEMAPSPIVPGETDAALPLSRAVRLRIVELARVSETVVLLAENDGGDDVQYAWHASAGEVTRLAPDVVAWRLRERLEAPFIQAVVTGDEGAAVSSFRFNLGGV